MADGESSLHCITSCHARQIPPSCISCSSKLLPHSIVSSPPLSTSARSLIPPSRSPRKLSDSCVLIGELSSRSSTHSSRIVNVHRPRLSPFIPNRTERKRRREIQHPSSHFNSDPSSPRPTFHLSSHFFLLFQKIALNQVLKPAIPLHGDHFCDF